MQLKASTIQVVFAEFHTTGRHASTDHAGLHEVLLVRECVTRDQEEVMIEKDWPEWAAKDQVKLRSTSEEYARLLRKYGPEMVESVYGKPHEGRLKFVCDRIHDAFLKGMPLGKIIELGKPESDFLDLEAEQAVETSMAEGEGPVDVPVSDTPEGVKELGGEDDGQDPVIDGNLVEFLSQERNWPGGTALAVARLVLEHNGKAIPDERMKAIRELRTAAPLKTMRAHLIEYFRNKKLAGKA